jgi:hypothetical protein
MSILLTQKTTFHGGNRANTTDKIVNEARGAEDPKAFEGFLCLFKIPKHDLGALRK